MYKTYNTHHHDNDLDNIYRVLYIVHQFPGLVLAYFLAAQVLDFLKGIMSSTASSTKVGSTLKTFLCGFLGAGANVIFLDFLFFFLCVKPSLL